MCSSHAHLSSDSGALPQTPTGDLPQEPLDGGFPSPGLLAISKVKVISFPSLHVAHWAALISVAIAPEHGYEDSASCVVCFLPIR